MIVSASSKSKALVSRLGVSVWLLSIFFLSNFVKPIFLCSPELFSFFDFEAFFALLCIHRSRNNKESCPSLSYKLFIVLSYLAEVLFWCRLYNSIRLLNRSKTSRRLGEEKSPIILHACMLQSLRDNSVPY